MKLRSLLATIVVLSGLLCRCEAATPKLIVAIAVDQLRYDYLERFQDRFGEGGFKLLMDRGAFLTFAHFNYVPTVTGPGHATFLSGAPPSIHGIIANDWFDKRTGRMMNCVSDPLVEGVGTSAGGVEPSGKRSPRNFVGSTFADELRLRFGSKVIGVSLKDRAAILPAGKKPAGAYWFDSGNGNFVTSTYYAAALPDWVQQFNAQQRPASFVGQTWRRLLAPNLYDWPDDAPGEGVMPGEKTTTFDHVVHPSPTEGFETIVPTPFGNDLLTDFAVAALEGEKLGTDSRPDLLTISFSSLDAAGHRFGPYSQEIQDVLLRLDRNLATIFAQLEKRIGLANVMIVLAADHGVAPAPEFAQAQGLDGERADIVGLTADLLAKIAQRYGAGKFLITPRLVDSTLYFNHELLREKQIAAEELASFIREWALSTGKYQAAFTRAQLLDGRAPGPFGQKVLLGYNAERSGDIALVLKPFLITMGGKAGTTHSAPYSYDTHIPVFFYGSAFRPGRYTDDFAITDIAATLCAALRMTEPSGSIGKPFGQALNGEPGETIPKPESAPKKRVRPPR